MTLTLFGTFTQHPAYMRTFRQLMRPFAEATCAGVHPFCDAQVSIQMGNICLPDTQFKRHAMCEHTWLSHPTSKHTRASDPECTPALHCSVYPGGTHSSRARVDNQHWRFARQSVQGCHQTAISRVYGQPMLEMLC